jgi:aerobic carbon-monoxide dehydrogenase medium subunit
MIPSNFEYHAPDSVEAALALIGQFGDDCKILSGGHSLIPLLKLRLASPAALVDIGRIRELGFIRVENDKLRIGSLATHASIATSEEIERVCPLLSETASKIGDQQVRNRGTIGGSLVHNDPAADWPAAVLALDAKIHVRSVLGVRVISAEDFFIGMLTSAVRTGEIVTEVEISLPRQPGASAYLKMAQPASGFAIAGVAVQLEHSNGVANKVCIGVTGVAPVAYRAKAAENAITGMRLEGEQIDAASDKVDTEPTDAMSDIHASGEYRRHLARVLTRRALRKAAGIE